MPYGETPGQVAATLARARREGLEAACLEAELRAGLPRGLLLAIASRETRCRDVVGDGGHGRGYFQIDDRSHGGFLRRVGVLASGVPPLREAAAYAAAIVAGNLAFGRAKGVPEARLLRFALAAYNAGAGGAMKAYRAGDPDRATAHGNYGRDVLERLRIVQAWLDGAPVPRTRPTIREGSRGRAVLELKRRLAAQSREPVRFAPTPAWGKRLTEAVREFQRANGLDDDGVVGPDTWSALDLLVGPGG